MGKCYDGGNFTQVCLDESRNIRLVSWKFCTYGPLNVNLVISFVTHYFQVVYLVSSMPSKVCFGVVLLRQIWIFFVTILKAGTTKVLNKDHKIIFNSCISSKDSMFNIPNEILIMRFLVSLAVVATMAAFILIMIGGDFSRAWKNDIEFKINCLRVSHSDD